MATKQVQTTADDDVTDSTTINDGGTVVNGGAIEAGNPMTVNKALVDVADGNDSDYGAKVVHKNNAASKDFSGVIEALGNGNGTFAFTPNPQEGERNFLIRGAGTADGNNEINNSASDVLAMPDSEVGLRGVSDIHGVITTRQFGESANADGSTSTVKTFNYLARPSTAMVPGRSKGDDAGAEVTFVNPEDGSAAVSTEIFPTRAVPGELTFMFGGPNPTNTNDSNAQDYKAKDSHEA